MVVNEYSDFRATTYGPGDTTFALPTSPACIPTGYAATPRDAYRILQSVPGFGSVSMTEIGLGGMNLRLPADQRY